MNPTKLMEIMLFGVLISGGLPQQQGWQSIVPLHSTRKDVETLLGSPAETRGVASTFKWKDGRVRVFYADGFCEGTANDWNVPPDTVVSLTFEPNKDLSITELKLDTTQYERVLDLHLQSAIHYINRKEGIRISTRQEKDGEDVQSISYEPAEKDFYLRCPNNSAELSKKEPYPGLKFDEYAELSFEKEKLRLDNFALYLKKNEATHTGYLILNFPDTIPPPYAESRAQKSKRYLTKNRRVDAKRVIVVMRRCREDFLVELYAVPNSMSPPIGIDCDK